MGRVVGRYGNHQIEVFYGEKFSTKTYEKALSKVKGFIVEAAKSGLPGKDEIFHYATDRKNEIPVKVPFNTKG